MTHVCAYKLCFPFVKLQPCSGNGFTDEQTWITHLKKQGTKGKL